MFMFADCTTTILCIYLIKQTNVHLYNALSDINYQHVSIAFTVIIFREIRVQWPVKLYNLFHWSLRRPIFNGHALLRVIWTRYVATKLRHVITNILCVTTQKNGSSHLPLGGSLKSRALPLFLTSQSAVLFFLWFPFAVKPTFLPLRLFYGPLPLPGNEPRKGNKFSWSTLLESIHPAGPWYYNAVPIVSCH
jgi:hypothetical protein